MSDELPRITDEEMRAGLAGSREYTAVFLRGTGVERTPYEVQPVRSFPGDALPG